MAGCHGGPDREDNETGCADPEPQVSVIFSHAGTLSGVFVLPGVLDGLVLRVHEALEAGLWIERPQTELLVGVVALRHRDEGIRHTEQTAGPRRCFVSASVPSNNMA